MVATAMAQQMPQTPYAQTAVMPPGSSEGNNETPDETGAKRKRQPRNSACRLCAAQKMKCVPSTAPGVCERCQRMNRECLPAVPKPRKKRDGQFDKDDEDREDVLEPVSTTSSAPAVRPSLTTPRRTEPSASVRVASSADVSKNALLARPDLSYQGSKSFEELLAHGLGFEQELNNHRVLVRGIDYNAVQSSLTIFRQIAVHFPFVEVLPSADVLQLAARKPFMTLAICTITSAANLQHQEQLSRAFRLALSLKVFVSGERSLDLLTGLMLYTAWEHHYLSNQQVYQQLCLLAGMCVDLGLSPHVIKNDSTQATMDVERERTFLGCYYLCCGLSTVAFQKPSPMSWNSALRKCAENVSQFGTLPSDRTLLALAELICAIEDVNGVLAIHQTPEQISPQHVEVSIRAVRHRLAALKREHPALSGTLSFTAPSIILQYRLQKLIRPSDITSLIQCAVAVKEYFDDLLTRPPSTLHHLAIVDWTNLLEALVALSQVAKPDPRASGWETGALASMLQPDSIMDALCHHMAAASANDTLNPRHDSLIQSLRDKCSKVKHSIAVDGNGMAARHAHHGGHHAPRPAYETALPDPREDGNLTSRGGVLDDSFWASSIAKR